MRFALDHDVSLAVRATLLEHGHECWTVGSAGMAQATDEDIAVYAHWLRCREPDAADVVKVSLDRIVADLAHMPDVVLTVGPNSYHISPG